MSSHIVTLRDAIKEARAAMLASSAVTSLVGDLKITFGNSRQADVNPRIVIEVSGAEYTPTFLQSRKVQTFTVEYACYSESVDECTQIMDAVREALDTYTSSDFAVRVADESFQADVDNTLLGVVVATFQDTTGIPGFDAGGAEALINAQEDLAAAEQDLADAQQALADEQANTATAVSDAVSAETDQWEAAVGMTLAEYQALPPADIYYQRPLHKREHEEEISAANFPHGYAAAYDAGLLNPEPPAVISHVARVDPTDTLGKTLINPNVFGNTHRYTYDDGTEATETNSTGRSGVLFTATNVDGYTGPNPQYIIDHYTGLGWYRSYVNSADATANNEWWNNKEFNTALATTDRKEYFAEVANITTQGYSDWRPATMQEYLFTYGGPTDPINIYAGNTGLNTDLDVYIPMISIGHRNSGSNFIFNGPIDRANYSYGVEGYLRSATNSALVGDASVANMDSYVSTTAFKAQFLLVRNHF